MTNFERVREACKNDKELADLISKHIVCPIRFGGEAHCNTGNCASCWLDFLQQEVPE